MKRLLALALHFPLHFHVGQLLKWWSAGASKRGIVASGRPAAWCLSGVFMHVCTHMQTHTYPAHTYHAQGRMFPPSTCMHTPHAPPHAHTPHAHLPCSGRDVSTLYVCAHPHAPLHAHTPRAHLPCSGRDVSIVTYAQTPRAPAHTYLHTLHAHTRTYTHTHTLRTPTMGA